MTAVIGLLLMSGGLLAYDIELDSGLKMDYIGEHPSTCDKVADNGYVVDLHYIGYLETGEQFDSTYDRQQPAKFLMGANQVIKGWEEGVMGMCVGEKRRLVIPPELGFGDQGVGTIPGGATLTYDVELVDSNLPPPPPPQVNVFKMMDANADGGITREELSNYLIKEAQAMPAEDETAKQILGGPPYLQNRVEEIFSHEDVDKDNFISHAEFQGPKTDPKPPNVFKMMDANGDQVISKEELTDYLKKQAEMVPGEEGKKIMEGQLYLNHVEEIFTNEDDDKDGYISFTEFRGPKHDEL